MDPRSAMPSFSEADIKKVLGSKEGQALLRLLSRDNGKILQEAANALKAGDPARAKSIVQPMLQNEEAISLLDKLSKK